MRKVFGLFTAVMLITTCVSAQYVTEEPYIVYQEPYIARSYGNANWSYVTAPQQYQRSGYTNAYAQAHYGQMSQDDAYFWNNSIMAKRFYATLRAGMGGTYGWDENKKTGKVENPVGAILSLSLGAYLTPNVRIDGEFAYHTKDDLYSGKDTYIKGKGEYSQYDFGLNAYYDFNAGSKIRPFIGVGVWGVTSKVTSDIENTYGDTRDTSRSKTNVAVSGALGLAFQLTDLVTLEAMGRGRYIFNEKIYNIEGLVGSRFRF